MAVEVCSNNAMGGIELGENKCQSISRNYVNEMRNEGKTLKSLYYKVYVLSFFMSLCVNTFDEHRIKCWYSSTVYM